MQTANNKKYDAASIEELYRLRTDSDEIQCHRLKVRNEMAGELLFTVTAKEKKLNIEEVFVDKIYRRHGLGDMLVGYAEETASVLGLKAVEVRPFSTDPSISDLQLREWYGKRGYMVTGQRMLKKIKATNMEADLRSLAK